MSLLVLAGLSGQAFAIGLYVERLTDMNVNVCPVCHQVIVPGSIHEDAEDLITTALGGALDEKGVGYTQELGVTPCLSVLIYRFQERRGGAFSVERPASVGFHVHLFDSSGLAKVFVFDETQRPLSENVFGFFTFLRRGARWITAGELSREGVGKAVDFFADDLKAAASGGTP
ncbi:MAG: hypothetical protein ABSB94_07500 [Syntrophorhabdales bacterium]